MEFAAGKAKLARMHALVGALVLLALAGALRAQTDPQPTIISGQPEALGLLAESTPQALIASTSASTNHPDQPSSSPSTSGTDQQATNKSSGAPASSTTPEPPVSGPERVAPTSAPVLRRSIEEVASELSKKYLNLELGAKQRASRTSGPPALQHLTGDQLKHTAEQQTSRGGPLASARAEEEPSKLSHAVDIGGQATTSEAESEIRAPQSGDPPPNTPRHVGHQQEEFFVAPADRQAVALQESVASSAAQPSSAAHVDSVGRPNVTATPHQNARKPGLAETPDETSGRPPSSNQPAHSFAQRKKKLFRHLDGSSDMVQCRQYLARHSAPQQVGADQQMEPRALAGGQAAASNGFAPLLIAHGQQLPCSCELRRLANEDRLASALPEEASIWLSCDSVQLMGNYFHNQASIPVVNVDSRSSSNDTVQAAGSRAPADHETAPTIVRFSQRDSGLQVLHAQTFQYLQLSQLRSIDISKNRIREIKLDAFHGLESSLEHLNLADNLLGDSRAILDGAQVSDRVVGSHQSNVKILSFAGELNRLKKLTWLSLRANKIDQLNSATFFNGAPPNLEAASGATNANGATSELSFLDLSENLFRSVPSDSIKSLAKLSVLKLNRNRITSLDAQSKFPKNLRYLDLSENSIRTIHHCHLIDLAHLAEIDLSHNQLNRLDKSAFVSSALVQLPSAGGSSGIALSNNRAVSSILGLERLEDLASTDQQASVLPQSADLALSASDEFHHVFEEAQLDRSDTSESSSAQDTDQLARIRRQATVEHPDEVDRMDINDLLADESVVSSIASQISARQATSEELSTLDVFNSTLTLNLSHNFFEEIPGDSLVKFASLRHLDISYNRIRNLDPNYLCSLYNLVENLRFLDLNGNLLSMPAINSSAIEPPNLRQLHRIFGCLQKLEKLSLSTNRLSQVDQLEPPAQNPPSPVYDGEDIISPSESVTNPDERLRIRFTENSGSRHLRSLDLSDNRLTLMPLIELSFNHIAQSNLTNATQLSRALQLDQWLSSRICLEELNLSFNLIDRLEDGDFEHVFGIRKLFLDFNRLTSLPMGIMRRFTSLDKISLRGNKLQWLAPLNALFERSVRTLRVLNLADNRIAEWPLIDKMALDTVLTLHNQEQMRSSNPSGDEKSPFSFALEELNLEGNLLNSDNASVLFDQLVYMKSLRSLNLGYNLINKIKSEWFKYSNRSLRRLMLNGNRINNIELGSFAPNQVNELEILNLEFNSLKELKRKSFDSLPQLVELNLAHNLIHTINSEAFNQVSSLQILKLNNNKLTSWKCEYFFNLCNSISGNINADILSLLSHNQDGSARGTSFISSLIELDLSHNSLSQLRANSISAHTKLTWLNLEHNKLSFIPHDLFRATTSGSTTDRQIQLISSLKYLNLAHNRIQTIDNINFKPLKNLLNLDLSFNELQTLGIDVVTTDSRSAPKLYNDKKQTSNVTEENADENLSSRTNQTESAHKQSQSAYWPSLTKLRHLNLSNNQLTLVNQSLLSELSPTALLNLNLSSNYLESESIPDGFYTKVIGNQRGPRTQRANNYDLIFTLKLESIDLSHNRLNEFPTNLLDNHYSSMESCDLSHNRIQNLVENSDLLIHIKSLDVSFNPLNQESNNLVLSEQRGARKLNLAATRLYAIQQATITADILAHSGYSGAQLRNRLANQTSQLDQIRSISHSINAPYLRHLNLSSNQLVWLSANVFDKLHSLQTLDLSNNQLTRLQLLNNPLSRVSLTLQSLNMASNLFTNLDANDFSQLAGLEHLDLSNLFSLNKLNCKFLSRLNSLRTLKMFNYPQVRHNLNIIASRLINSDNPPSDRMRSRMREELLLSSLGSHCFELEPQNSYESTSQQVNGFAQRKWLDLKELDIEFFHARSSDGGDKVPSDGLQLGDELKQVLGPSLARLRLVGHNITSISRKSLIGFANDKLELIISYTSISEPPLQQIMSVIPRHTKLDLDLRHNLIHSIDVSNLQLMEELQLNNQLSKEHDQSPIRLGFNPFRCDCQTRPLWLWLNQRPNVATSDQSSDEQVGGGPEASNTLSNYWLKLGSISETSDIKCSYPQKLRGKLVQHVNYNELICGTSSRSSSAESKQAKRKQNDTRSYDGTHYHSESSDANYMEDDEYLDSEAPVKITRFNRYPVTNHTNTLFMWNNIVVPSIHEKNDVFSRDAEGSSEASTRMGKRDQHSSNDMESSTSTTQHPHDLRTSDSPPRINFNKHLPNTYQKHSRFNLQDTFERSNGKHHTSGIGGSKHSLLTDFDVYILTVMSIAMSVMSFIIISICLLKHKLDLSDQEQILNTHSKMMISQALLTSGFEVPVPSNKFKKMKKKSKKSATSSSGSSSSGSKQSRSTNATGLTASTSKRVAADIAARQNSHRENNHQILVPIGRVPHPPPPSSHNFLMRSPTMRRMQGLATNASEWFKYTLRAYPALNNRRRSLFFIGDNVPASSHLVANHLGARKLRHEQVGKSIIPSSLSAGCPNHGFRALLRGRKDQANPLQAGRKCSYCAHLIASIRHTRVHALTKDKNPLEPSGLQAQGPSHEGHVTGSSEASANIDTQQVSAGMIKALARQFEADEEAVTFRQQGCLHPDNGSNDGRQWNQQVKVMKTFGAASSAAGVRLKEMASMKSQIPTIDVDGRFAYQTESRINSASCTTAPSLVGASSDTRDTDVTSAGPHEGVLILMPEFSDHQLTPSHMECEEFQTVQMLDATNHAYNISETSIMMNDECSQTSSPVVYGFMRSSPSVTTVSSTTNNSHQYVANHRPSEGGTSVALDKKVYATPAFVNNNYEFIHDERDVAYDSSNDNNNEVDYAVSRKQETAVTATNASLATDDQIIVSRL